MVTTESFSQLYEHMKDKVKSFSASLLILASLITNWEFLYFLGTSDYSARETISIAADVYFAPLNLIWVYILLSALVPVILIISKTIYNRVNVPLERLFESYFRKITYPTREEYEKLITKYEALEKSFRSGELYSGLTQDIKDLEEEKQSLKQDNEALNELIDDLKNSTDRNKDSESSEQTFIDKFFFGEETEEIALILYNAIKNSIKGDSFTVRDFAEHFPNDTVYDEYKIKEVLERWESNGLLSVRRAMTNAGFDKYRLSERGIEALLSK